MSARSEPSGPGGRRARILIVDDEPLNVDWLEQELAALGFETDSAGNGVEALDRIADRPPDLVLLDVMMPVMDGIAALRILKEDPETRLLPVVVMTALSEVDDRVRAIEAGADDFLSKPVDDRELRARINTALRTKWAIDATFSELRSAADHLERSGREERDVVVVAVELGFADVTDTAATSFVLRRQRAAASQLLEAHGGKLAGDEPGLLLAVFDAADAHVRARAGAEAALAVSALAADPDSRSGRGHVALRVGIDAGRAVAGVARSANDPSRGWVYTVDGRPAQSALELVRAVQAPEIAVGERAAGLLGDAFRLERPSDGDVPYLLRSASESGEPVGVRVLATILVTDIVGSTEHVERLGDHAWTELLEATNASFRREFERHLGEEVDTRGDGFLVLFAHPAQAIRCGVAIHERAAERGLAIRVGIHTGEVERVGDTVRGIAVHLVARVADEAEAGEVLVTGTTRDLVAGSGLELEDRGEHELKGVAEPRRLFAVVTN
jgi:CheY-like chemotaxis protein/class 3 adenylate cyclase